MMLNYVTIPGIPQKNIDPTFIASVFTGTLATFGVVPAKKKDDTAKDDDKNSKSLNMKRLIGAAVAATLLPAPAQADLVHRIQTSVQLSVDAAASNATRVPSVYSVSGTNIDVTDGTTSGNVGGLFTTTAEQLSDSLAQQAPLKLLVKTSASPESFIEGDKPSTGSSVSSGVIGTLPAFGNTVTSAGGVAGSLAGTVGNDRTITITAGGAGTRVTGQYVSDLTISN